MVDLRFLYEMELPHRAVAVYQYLVYRANREGRCWPAVPTIARDMKLSEKTVRRALDDLRKHGLIETEQTYRGNGGKSSLLFEIKRP
ncbi:MAG: helix-turn-helix domain-containing protein [Lachnospiraceae bacterium]|nr:helix-turn-helix domain-containing protein [Lachnospiraceae bacterium]